MLTYLLSQPDDWAIGVDSLIRDGCGRDQVYRILKELRDAGHLVHERVGVGQSKPPVWLLERLGLEAGTAKLAEIEAYY